MIEVNIRVIDMRVYFFFFLYGKVWGVGEAFLRRDQGLTLCWSQLAPADSKMALPLAKGCFFSSRAGDVSVKTHLKRNVKHCSSCERGVRKDVREKTLVLHYILHLFFCCHVEEEE